MVITLLKGCPNLWYIAGRYKVFSLKKYRLKVDDTPEFFAFGIVSSAADYRLCFQINRALNLNLDKSGTVFLRNIKSKENIPFPSFVFNDAENRISYYIVKNRDENNFLLPAMKKVDFIFLLVGNIEEKFLSGIRSLFSNISLIDSSFPLTNEQLLNINLES